MLFKNFNLVLTVILMWTSLLFLLQNLFMSRNDDFPPHSYIKNKQPMGTHWIVVYVLPYSTGCDVTPFSGMLGWNIVVVGGSNPPHCCRSTFCVSLTSEKQDKLGFSITSIISPNSESRKMIGYLYAISRGATIIVDIECDIIPPFNETHFILSTNTTGLTFTGGRIFNPFRHFGYPMLFPRGFPGNMLNRKPKDRYVIVDIPTPLIQHKLTNFVIKQEDVTSLRLSGDHNVTFDRSSPPVFLSGDHFAPISSLNTMFFYDALWLLFLPSKCKNVDCDIVRGYWAQRLVQEVGGATGFLSSMSHSSRKQTERKSFMIKKPSFKTVELLQLLSEWNCSLKYPVFQCARMLFIKMMESGFINESDVELYDSWISDLKTVGYILPPHKQRPTIDVQSYWSPPVIYSSPNSLISNIQLERTENTREAITTYIIKPMEKICQQQNTMVSDWLSPLIQDIMLVVVFNYVFLFENIPYIEFIHRRFFKHILYCGPKLKAFEDIMKTSKVDHLIFVEGVDVDYWFYLYRCMMHAATMHVNVTGFLHIGDDILLNTWNIMNLPRDRMWMEPLFSKVSRSQVKHRWWTHWNKPRGRTAVNRAMDEIVNISITNPNDTIIKNFLAMYELNVGMQYVIHRSIDIFYLPRRFSKDFVHLAKIFRKHNTLLALTVTCIHAGLDRLDHVINLRGKSLWGGDRDSVWRYFNASDHYLHPFKAGKDLKDEAGQAFFCNTYLNLLNKHYARYH